MILEIPTSCVFDPHISSIPILGLIPVCSLSVTYPLHISRISSLADEKNSTFAGQTPSWDFAGKYIPCCSSNSSVFAAKNAHVCRPFSPHTQNFRRADHQTHGPGRDFGARQLCQLRADAIAPPRRSVAGAGDAGRSLSAVERWDSDGMDFFSESHQKCSEIFDGMW